MKDAAQFKYRAFLSYSHSNKAWGKWLHRSLEQCRIDRDLVGRETRFGPVPKSLRPIFRDREDFSAGHSLTEQTIAALDSSLFLIVLCSRSAAQSYHVNEEIRCFKALGRADRVLPIIVDNEVGGPADQCFPPALRFKVSPEGDVTDQPEEPIAADARSEGDGRQFAKQKIIAGLLGVPVDEIIKRAERARKRRTVFWGALAGLFLLLSIAAGGSAIYASQKLFESEARLDSAIEIAYGFVVEATDLSNRVGVPLEVTLGFLTRGEDALNALLARGDSSDLLTYRRALMLLSLADSFENLGRVDEALRRSTESRDLLQRLTDSNPNKRDWVRSLSRAHTYVGVYLSRQRKHEDALDAYEKGLSAAESLLSKDSEDVDAVTLIARNLINIGNAQGSLGLISQALASHQKAIDAMLQFANTTELTEAINKYPVLEYMAFETLDKRAALQAAIGAFEQALGYHKAILKYRQLSANSDPLSIENQSAVHDAYLSVGNVQIEVGLTDDALSAFKEGLAIAKKLSDADTDNVAHKRAVALLRDGVGRALLSKGSATEALEIFQANLESAQSFNKADTANFLWKGYLGIGHERVGDALMALGDSTRALGEYRKEESILSTLLLENPADVEMQMRLARCQFKIGDALFTQDRSAEAAKALQASFDFWSAHANTYRAFVEYQAYLFQTVWRLAEIRGDIPTLQKAKGGLEWLDSRKWLPNEQKRWLSQVQIGPTSLEADCSAPDPDRAIVSCTKIILGGGEKQKVASAYLRRGDAYRAKNQFENAISDLTEAIRADAALAPAFNSRGLAHASLSRFNESVTDYNRAIQLDPKFAIAFSNRGLAMDAIGQHDKAIADFSEAIRLDPNNALSRFNRGLSYLNASDFDEAIEDFGEVIRLKPEVAQGYFHRGSAYKAKGELQRAVDDLTQSLRLQPASLTYNLRGVTYFEMDELDQALNDFNEAIRLDPNNAIAYTNRGRVYERLGRFDDALAEHNTAIKFSPTLAIAYANRGLAYEGKGEQEKALEEFEHALSLDPKLERARQGRERAQGANFVSH